MFTHRLRVAQVVVVPEQTSEQGHLGRAPHLAQLAHRAGARTPLQTRRTDSILSGAILPIVRLLIAWLSCKGRP